MVDDAVLRFESLANPESWVENARRPDCPMCYTKFTTFKRRHRCRVCGDIMCGTCYVKRRADFPMVGVITVKVCTACANNHSTSTPKKNSVKSKTPKQLRAARDSFSVDNLRGKHPEQSDSTNTYTSSMGTSQHSVFHGLGRSLELDASSLPEAEILRDQSDLEIDRVRNLSDVRARWIPYDDLRDVQPIGSGGRYDVWLVRLHSTRGSVASKRLRHDCVNGPSLEQFIDEVELMSQLQHPRIVELVGVAWTMGHKLQALFEYVPRGDLRSFLGATARDQRSRSQLGRQKLQIALDLAEALVHLHSFTPPLVHGALESRKVLLTEDLRAKLSGIRATAPSAASSTTSTSTSAPSSRSRSRRWLAPEALSKSGLYLTSSDVYAFGVILCELDTHELPYSDCLTPQGDPLPEQEIDVLIAHGDLQPTISRSCPLELRRLAMDCLAFSPSKRPSAVEITVRLRMFLRSYGLERERSAEKEVDLYLSPGRSRSQEVTF